VFPLFHLHSFSLNNLSTCITIGHLIWDDFLGLYTLLDIFDQADDKTMLTHMYRPETEDFSGDDDPEGFDLIEKFIPLLGKHDYGIETLEGEYELNLTGIANSSTERHVICADNGLLGSGIFSDHGDHHWHGHQPTDYEDPHNVGRGGHLRRFRKWMMEHVGVNPNTPIQREPYLILVSKSSSTKNDRKNIKFGPQVKKLKKHFGDRVVVKKVQLSELSLVEQIELLSRTAVFISTVGGATVSGTFLPKGASVILYMREERPLDWDWWNNFPHVKAHWFPMDNKTDAFHLNALVETVESQLDYIDRH